MIFRSLWFRANPNTKSTPLSSHQLIKALRQKPEDDLYGRPGRPNLRDDSLDLLQAAEAGVVIGFAQARAQNVFSAEDVERQIALAVVIPVEEASFLFPVQRQVGGVYVQDDLR